VGYFCFDESIHPRAEFALGAFAYSEAPLDGLVSDALRESGLTPGVEEFKSGARMDRELRQANARNLLQGIFRANCRLGVVVSPDSPREVLGTEALRALKKILATCRFRSEAHDVYFDAGIFSNRSAGERAATALSVDGNCTLHFE
jgi:hypothetical protein